MTDDALKFRSGAARTRDGTAALIYCTDAPLGSPIHGRIAGSEYVAAWGADGRYLPERESVLDLMPNGGGDVA